ncbi:hypothetical protein [Pseudoalteromonas phage J2-1_QLiu-2017]|nr:hypothetical protein [Pseudoalteromonas phage J2-1_QLiu-2017]
MDLILILACIFCLWGMYLRYVNFLYVKNQAKRHEKFYPEEKNPHITNLVVTFFINLITTSIIVGILVMCITSGEYKPFKFFAFVLFVFEGLLWFDANYIGCLPQDVLDEKYNDRFYANWKIKFKTKLDPTKQGWYSLLKKTSKWRDKFVELILK